MEIKLYRVLVVILLVVGVWQLFRGHSLSENLNDLERHNRRSDSIISEQNYRIDTLMISREWEKEKRIEAEENYDIIANDYREATNEEHHLKIIAVPDTLSREFLYQVANRYDLLPNGQFMDGE